MLSFFCFIFFFFQAEDGIRDKLVTGVQTCALPISGGALHSLAGHELSRNRCYELVSEHALDAIVVLSLSASSEMLESFLARYPRLPIVTVGHEVAGVPVVVADNASGMRDAVMHLISGHGRR